MLRQLDLDSKPTTTACLAACTRSTCPAGQVTAGMVGLLSRLDCPRSGAPGLELVWKVVQSRTDDTNSDPGLVGTWYQMANLAYPGLCLHIPVAKKAMIDPDNADGDSKLQASERLNVLACAGLVGACACGQQQQQRCSAAMLFSRIGLLPCRQL